VFLRIGPDTVEEPVVKKFGSAKGKQLSVMEQEEELAALNPFARANRTTGGKSPVGTSYRGYATQQGQSTPANTNDVEIGDDLEENAEESSNYCNSSTMFLPHHFGFAFTDDKRVKFFFLAINLPSGVLSGGLDGKIDLGVSSCGKKLELKCEWPEVFYSSKWLIAGVEKKLQNLKFNQEESFAKTIYSIESSFQLELGRIRSQKNIRDNLALGGTAEFPLPFECDRDIYLLNSTNDALTRAVSMFVILKKKTEKNTDILDLSCETTNPMLEDRNAFSARFSA
jgi:hypothetical protein